MKKIIFLGCLVLFLPAMVFAQEKIEAPVWNLGDKWNFTSNGSIEVVKADQSGFILKFSDGKCKFETQGYNTILFEKSNRNRINAIEGSKSKKYSMGLRKILNFPLSSGKQWKWSFSATSMEGVSLHPIPYDYSENYSVLGWEEVGVQAGKFKTLKLEYKRKITQASGWEGLAAVGQEIENLYWYSPDAKYFVKCEYDKAWMKGNKEIFNWELTSFQAK